MLRSLLIPFLLLATTPALADPLLYRLDDADTTVWLLGSVHVLRSGDYPLDARIESAYESAARVVLEVDPAELAPAHLGALMLSMGRHESGTKLSDAFTEAEFRTLRSDLAAMGLDVAQFQAFEPWVVALQVFGFNLARNGFANAEGVDAHFAARAKSDGKHTGGLESAQEQFALFDRLPVEAQKAFLLDTVEDSDGFRAEMDRLVGMWRRGDVAAFESLLDEEFSADPDLRESMLDARNRKWLEPIESYLDQPGATLVIVGALHLVGDNGLVSLLEEKGHPVKAVR